MFNDDDDNDGRGPWFEEGHENVPPGVMTIESLRDKALELFSLFLAKQSGIEVDCTDASIEEKQNFLSLKETENIARSFSSADNGEMMAVGGESPKEAMQKISDMMAALVHRVMSNVIAEGARRDLIDVAFDEEHDGFAFKVSKKGEEFVAQNKALFEDENDAE